MSTPRLKILYLASSGRSGSTLLARILGELPGVCNVGELGLQLLFQDVREFQVACGCGLEETACPFWRDIVPERPGAMRDYARDYQTRHLWRAWRRGKNRPDGYPQLLRALRRLYGAIAERAQSDWIIDTSTNAAIGLYLRDLPEIEFHSLQLVRDVRDIVASWRESKAYLPRLPPRQIVAGWWFSNLLAEWLARDAGAFGRLRLEDLLAAPQLQLEQIAARLQKPMQGFSVISPGMVRIGGKTQHVLLGNPDKFQYRSQYEIPLQARKKPLRRMDRLITSALAGPLLRRYGYAWGAGAEDEATAARQG